MVGLLLYKNSKQKHENEWKKFEENSGSMKPVRWRTTPNWVTVLL